MGEETRILTARRTVAPFVVLLTLGVAGLVLMLLGPRAADSGGGLQ